MNSRRERRGRVGNGIWWLFACCCSIVAAQLLGCAANDSIAGTGSQGGNARVAGLIYDESGNPASGARVYLRSHNYTADTAGVSLVKRTASRRDDRTDANGLFMIDSIDTGSYFIEVTDGKKHAVLLACNVAQDDTLVRIPGATLHPTGVIKGMFVPVPGTPVSHYIQLYGIERVGMRDSSTGGFIIKDVPAGNYRVRIVTTAPELQPVDLDTISVASGETTDIGTIDIIHMNQWRYSGKFYLNTSVSGADVAGTVVNFPVLVRLHTGNFDFSQAMADGGDISFVKVDGTTLPFEIERWDVAAGHAEIWVKADTVFGNDSTQSITMYWGASTMDSSSPQGLETPESNGAAVFDTGAGFQGVWHLAEPADTITHDATANRFDGTPSGTAPTPADGTVGIAKEFNGVSNGIRMKGTASGALNFPENARYTVSAWVYSDTLDDKWHLIVGKSNNQYYLKQQIAARTGNWEFVEYHDKVGWQLSESPVSVKTWKYLTGVREGDQQFLYIDGQLVESAIKPNYDTASRNTSEDVTIGRFQSSVKFENEGFCLFDGKIDEVRISSVARSADWIKLCFMNQREDDRLVVFRR